MAAATVTFKGDVSLAHKIAQLTATNGETWVPGLSKILAVNATSNFSGTAVTATFSGTTVTINASGMTDELVTVDAMGRL